MAALLMLLGAAMIVFGAVATLRYRGRQSAIAGWPVAQGSVTHAGNTSSTIAGDDVDVTKEYFTVAYEYSVAGQTYTGKTAPGSLSNKTGPSLYSEGKPVSVHYDPKDPSKSQLGGNVWKISPWSVLWWSFGALVLFFALVFSRHH